MTAGTTSSTSPTGPEGDRPAVRRTRIVDNLPSILLTVLLLGALLAVAVYGATSGPPPDPCRTVAPCPAPAPVVSP